MIPIKRDPDWIEDFLGIPDDSCMHTCPYIEELFDDHESLCDCSEEKAQECANDI